MTNYGRMGEEASIKRKKRGPFFLRMQKENVKKKYKPKQRKADFPLQFFKGKKQHLKSPVLISNTLLRKLI